MIDAGHNGKSIGIAVDDLGEFCDMAISALSENKGEWIPVSERLPEEGHVVYCQLTDGSHEILFLYVYSDGQMNWVGRRMSDYKVEAWRELPEPYKGESEE